MSQLQRGQSDTSPIQLKEIDEVWYFPTSTIAAPQEEFLDELKSSGEFLLLVSLSRSTAIHRSKGGFHGLKDNSNNC